MKTILMLKLLILMLVVISEGIFFNPHKRLWNLFSNKDKKEKPDVHHYHLHYYPLPVQIVDPPLIAPEKRQLDKIHDEKFRSLGWSDDEYSVPDPKVIYPSKLDGLWNDDEKLSSNVWSSDLFESTPPKESSSINVQVPLHQQIIFQLPKEKEEMSFLSSLLSKIQSLKKFFFSNRKDDGHWDDRNEKSLVNTDIYNYFYYSKQNKENKD